MSKPLRAGLMKMRLPLILFLILIIPLFIGPHVSYSVKSFLFALSLSMKAVLLFVLPFIIFSFLFSSLLNLKSGVIKFVVALVGMVFLSNCAAILTGFTVGSLTLTNLSIPSHHAQVSATVLEPMWHFSLPKLIPNQIAIMIGFVCGILFSFKRNAYADKVAKHLNYAANVFLKYIFVPLLPIFILGFVFKLEQDQMLEKALRIYGPVFFIVVGTQISYMIFLYLCVSKFSIKRCLVYFKNVFPAIVTGFSTVSSAATLPILILATEKNLPNPRMAEVILPATINIHTLGSAIGITVLTLTTLLTFGHGLPPIAEFVQFGLYYAVAKFAVAAVPGGAIIVVTPLLEHYLGFSGEMVGLITAIYMLFDPFGTATNVTGNGFFAIAFSKIFKFNFANEHTNTDAKELTDPL